MENLLKKNIKVLVQMATFTLLILSIFIVINIVKSFKSDVGELSQDTITVKGEAEIFATPDVATISFGASATNKDLKKAQKDVEKVSSTAIDSVKNLGIESKDIQTTYYNTNPQYDYSTMKGRSLIGYKVSQTTTVKVHDLSKVSDILGVIGVAKVSNISGPNFSIEDKDALKEKVRGEAIEKAKAKAKVLAGELGVKLGRIISYSDNNSGGPIMYAKENVVMDSAGSSPVSPTIETGQNRIHSSVSIVYKIK